VTADTAPFPACHPGIRPEKHAFSSKHNSARCRRDPRAVLWPQGAVLGATQHCTGFHLHHREGNAAVRLENSFHILYNNQNRLGIFKTASDDHFVMYF